MVLSHEALSPQACEAFGLARNPFAEDVQCRADVYIDRQIEAVRVALMNAAVHRGFVAVVGESGSGKTTLVEELGERAREEAGDIILIKPYVLAMESDDRKGMALKSSAIAEAISRTLAPKVKMHTSAEERFSEVHELLRDSHRAGRRHLLVIEEAHCLPVATLKHLKRFLELKDGMQRLLGVALVAQPELAEALNSQYAEVREVMQRCAVVPMAPLADLEAYLRHKLARAGAAYDALFTPDAADALRARLLTVPSEARPADAVSLAYPLVVNNLAARALNAAACAGWPKVDAQVVAGC